MKKVRAKTIGSLTISDLRSCVVWEFVSSEESRESLVRPIKSGPVARTNSRVIGTQVRLANGASVWALLGNIDTQNPMLNQHLLTLSVFCGNRWFTMARYHDIDAKKNGPKALARFLGLPVDEVFPISYDLRQKCKGRPGALLGKIEKTVLNKLTREQIIEVTLR